MSEQPKNLNDLLDELHAAKSAVWEYVSSEETTYLHLEIQDFRKDEWTGVPATNSLAWMWAGDDDTYSDHPDWEYTKVIVKDFFVRDGLTFVFYDDGDGTQWAVFDNAKVRKPGS